MRPARDNDYSGWYAITCAAILLVGLVLMVAVGG